MPKCAQRMQVLKCLHDADTRPRDCRVGAAGVCDDARRLVDWRQKGLLPPLVKHGRGRGGGWIYGWEDSFVAEQAIAVQELLAWHSRTDWLYVPLWCLGFSVPATRIRAQLRDIVNAQLDYVVGDAATREDVAHRVSKLSVVGANEYRRQRAGRPGLTAEAVEYWLNLLVAGRSDYAPNHAALVIIAEALFRAIGAPADPSGTTKSGWSIKSSDLRLLQRWASRYASLPLLRDAILEAADREMQCVHDDWRSIAQLERTFEQVVDNDSWENFHVVWMRMVAAFCPWLSLIDLSLRRRGLGSELDRIRWQMGEFVARFESEPALRATLRRSWDEERERKKETHFEGA